MDGKPTWEHVYQNPPNLAVWPVSTTQLSGLVGRPIYLIGHTMTGALTLATIFGTKVRIHLTFPILLIWVATVEAIARGPEAATTGVIFVLMLFVCVIAHEFGHILVARHYGGRTVDILLLPIGGVSRMERMPAGPGEELAVALAGPAVSIGVGVALIMLVGLPTPDAIRGPELGSLLPRLAVANLFLAVFNLMPAFPMDGGRALRAGLSMRAGRLRATRLAAQLGHVFGLLFGTFGLLSGNPIMLLIGIFIYFGASAELANTELNERALSLTVADVMRTNLALLEARAPLGEAINLMLHAGQHFIPVLGSAREILGVATRDRVIGALHRLGMNARLADAIETNVPIVTPRQKLADAIARMQGLSAPAVVVVSPQGEFAGMITPDTLLDLMLVDVTNVGLFHRPRSSDPDQIVSVPKSI
jgi:stage IV sporulation protein FB